MPLGQALHVLYFASRGYARYSDIVRECSRAGLTMSRETVADWKWLFYDACLQWLEASSQRGGQIGGPGEVVEIDEAKFGRRKFHRGRFVDGQWVLGMVQLQVGPPGTQRRGGSVRLEVCPSNRRDASTLLGIIKKHGRPGTTVMTDEWAAYRALPTLGYQHLTVNHSQNFVDPSTWANTQTIESTWRALRRGSLSAGGTAQRNLAYHLFEYMWRREMAILGKDSFMGFLEIVAEVYGQQSTGSQYRRDRKSVV